MRVPLFLRLVLACAGVAALSTLLALFILERSLAGDLERAAEGRLESAAQGSRRLFDLHVADVRRRYTSLTVEPRFRAALEARDQETLSYFASELLKELDAVQIRFLDGRGTLMASGGKAPIEIPTSDREFTLTRNRSDLFLMLSVPMRAGGEAGQIQIV